MSLCACASVCLLIFNRTTSKPPATALLRNGLNDETYLNTMAAVAPGCSGIHASSDFIIYWLKHLSIILQKANTGTWENLKDICTDRHACRHTDKQPDRHACRHTDKQPDRQTARQTHRQRQTVGYYDLIQGSKNWSPSCQMAISVTRMGTKLLV